MNYSVFTSESVCSGHPDKICDRISDSILDAALAVYPKSRVAVETLVTRDHVFIAGEVTCPKKLNYAKIARRVIKELGYTKNEYGFTWRSPVEVYVHQQSPDIACGVNTGGAGDQGMMFGYAVDETPQLLPLPIALAHDLARRMDKLKSGRLPYLRPDGKTEVTVRYASGRPVSVEKVVLACPHDPRVSSNRALSDLFRLAVQPAVSASGFSISLSDVVLNGTGKWEIGGPASDTGVTGRKIIVDSYGGMARIGGGAFSGKDPTKVDRSAAYAARYIAKNIVAAGLARRCEVQLAYVIGFKEPITKAVDTFGTGTKSQKHIEKFAWSLLDLSVPGIVTGLNLLRPIYAATSAYGHFGRPDFPWELIPK